MYYILENMTKGLCSRSRQVNSVDREDQEPQHGHRASEALKVRINLNTSVRALQSFMDQGQEGNQFTDECMASKAYQVEDRFR